MVGSVFSLAPVSEGKTWASIDCEKRWLRVETYLVASIFLICIHSLKPAQEGGLMG